jgi:hypothetical protein
MGGSATLAPGWNPAVSHRAEIERGLMVRFGMPRVRTGRKRATIMRGRPSMKPVKLLNLLIYPPKIAIS